jgi:hypothetical protein
MTALQKSIVGATLALAIAINIYHGRHNSQLRDRLETSLQQHAQLAERVRQLLNERDSAVQTLDVVRAEKERLRRNAAEELRLRGEVARLRTNAQEIARMKAAAESEANDPAAATVRALTERVKKLKEFVERTPEVKIPEFQFLRPEDWLEVSGKPTDRQALCRLRQHAEEKFGDRLLPALRKYVETHDSKPPTDLAQLQPYFESPMDDSVLQRWRIAPASEFTGFRVGKSEWYVTQRAFVDEDYDLRMVITPANGWGYHGGTVPPGPVLSPAAGAFRAANDGRDYENLSQLVPYLTTPEQRAALDRLLENERRWQSILSR